MPLDQPTFEQRLQAVEARIDRALKRSGRKRSDVTLVAVSKKFSASHIQIAYAAGCRDFGENYVQEFATKREELPSLEGAKFHLIGHLQSNKAKLAVDLFDVIETADSAKLLQRLDAQIEGEAAQLEVLIEVKLSDETSKTGAQPALLPELLAASRNCSRLRVTGLMTIPPWSEDAEQSRPYFRRLAHLAGECGLTQLSMGMSADFEAAIEEGATIIRVGTALFGARPKPLSAVP